MYSTVLDGSFASCCGNAASPGLALAYDDHQGELQAHELSTSGERSVLVERLLQHKVPMRRLFRALKQ
eukprot:gene31707-39967_t